MTLQVPSRRGFLIGMLAAASAPAIIRTSGLIMPIKPVILTSLPYLTASIIAQEFAKQMYLAGARRKVGLSLMQSHVEFIMQPEDRMLELNSFVNRFLAPAARVLTRHSPNIGGELTLPQGVHEAAHGYSGGFAVRMVTEYSLSQDKLITRFDVTNN